MTNLEKAKDFEKQNEKIEKITNDDWCEIQFQRLENWIDVLSDRSIWSFSKRSLLFQFEIQKEWCWNDLLDLQFKVRRDEWNEFFEILVRNFKIYDFDAINCNRFTTWWTMSFWWWKDESMHWLSTVSENLYSRCLYNSFFFQKSCVF